MKCKACNDPVPSNRTKFCCNDCSNKYWKKVHLSLCICCKKNMVTGFSRTAVCKTCRGREKYKPPAQAPISKDEAIEGVMQFLLSSNTRSDSLIEYSGHNFRSRGKERKQFVGLTQTSCPECGGLAYIEPVTKVVHQCITFYETVTICVSGCEEEKHKEGVPYLARSQKTSIPKKFIRRI